MKALIIHSAKLVGEELQSQFGMIPLHSNHLERQFVMLAIGLKLIDELMKKVLL